MINRDLDRLNQISQLSILKKQKRIKNEENINKFIIDMVIGFYNN